MSPFQHQKNVRLQQARKAPNRRRGRLPGRLRRGLREHFAVQPGVRYGEMKVEIVTEGRLIGIVKDGFDAGVRLAEAVPQDMIAVPLGPHTRHVVIGAPSYFSNRSRPNAPVDLTDHECICAHHSSGALYRWEFERHGEAMRIDVPGSLTLDEPDMMALASSAGLGLAYVAEWMVADDIALVRQSRRSSTRVDALVSRILPLLSGTPPHGSEPARVRRSGPGDCLSESRTVVLMDTRPVVRVRSGLREVRAR
jgi:DNA-binding transcriptional LysR family regulator